MKSGIPTGSGLIGRLTTIPGLLPMADNEPLLTDVQYDALSAGVARGQSVLVSAPTSTGKTLIGWWAIAAAVAAGGRAVYLVSHRALAKQKFEEAQRLFLPTLLENDRAEIVCATGDAVEDAFGRKTSAPMAASILIATYEKYLGCLSTGGPPRDLTDVAFICDEVQLIGDKGRGQNVELLLTLLKQAGWKQFVALSAVLSEKDAASLAEWLAIAVVRNPTREKSLRIECRTPTGTLRVVAAPGRDGDIEEIRGGKDQSVIGILNEIHGLKDGKPTIVFCMKVDDTYKLAQEWIAGKTKRHTVVVPPGLDIDLNLRQCLEYGAAFHNAELSEDERIFVEDRITSGAVDVVYATTTLAAGVNFPLGAAVFSSWKRWNGEKKVHEPIDRAEFQNMAGRVGRMGQAASEGLVILSADGGSTANAARVLMNMKGQDDLGHGIKPDDFGALTLQLFAGKLCNTRDEAFSLLASTLSAAREISSNSAGITHWKPKLNQQIDRLITAGCLIESSYSVSITSFGLAVARTGLKPETAMYFIDGLADHAVDLISFISSADQPDAENNLLFILAHAALASPEFGYSGGKPTRYVNWRVSSGNLISNDYARRLSNFLFERPWAANVGAANGALLVTSWAAGQSRRDVERIVSSVRVGTIQSLASDVAWILTGIAEIVSSVTSPTMADESKPPKLRGDGPAVDAVRQLARGLRRQASRAASGLPTDVLWMTEIDLPGRPRRLSRVQILALKGHGLARPIDLMKGDGEADTARRAALQAIENPVLANQVRDAAKGWKVADRQHCRKFQLKRAAKLGGEAIIDALYTAKGDSLEDAFAEAIAFIGENYEKLDGKGKIAHPDFLITIDDCRPIVVEIKSKLADTDFVPLNAATEVLTASELIGLKGNFCITLCSPGVEPSVPGVIERCGRLCVVDVSDFAEAVVRLREGRLKRDEFYNWLTTPGIALMEDLPVPQ